MAWTYSGDPSASTLDAVRFVIGDTDTTDQLLQNAEIDYLITKHGTVRVAAAESCRAIAAKYARLMSRSIGGLSADFSAKHRQYLEMAQSIMDSEESFPVSPFLSGWNSAAKEAVELQQDRETTFARKGDMDNPRANAVDDYYPFYYRGN